MLRIPDLKVEPPTVQTPFEFPLDPFQKHAIHAISNDENVLVTAKTGSGKTLVGEYQIYHSLKKGKRVFYTTPIKSLSNQKFHDLKKIHKSVGIMTGDIKFCPQADIVIMTTEILRNLLFRKGKDIGIPLELSLDNLDAVVFDEVHYINDPNRGKVWEECLTMLPREINLVLLSATIDQPEKFANWLGEIKQKPIHLISTQYRIVPLVHMLPNKEVMMDCKDVYDPKVYDKFLMNYYRLEFQKQNHKQRVATRDSDEVVKRGEQNKSFIDRMNKLIDIAELPALFFVFSRNLCTQYAKKVSQDCLTTTETAEVKHIINFHLRTYPDINKLSQYNELVPLLIKGVAFHHSGLLPVLKEIIEILFSKGFIKVLFATETFAVGINMPTKTVVFTSYRKYDDSGFRMLTTSEYIQMAGRAGRRGKDDKGIVIYLPNKDPEDEISVKQMFTGKTITVNSQMKFDYEYILSTMFYQTDFQNDTYWMVQRKEDIARFESEIQTKKERLTKFEPDMLDYLKQRNELETSIKSSVNSEKRKYQQQLESLKNKNISKNYDIMWREYMVYKYVNGQIVELERNLKGLKNINDQIDVQKVYLTRLGFIEDNILTQKGILASQIHEANPIVLSHIFYEKWVDDKSIEELVCYLSMFLEEPEEFEITNLFSQVRKYVSDLPWEIKITEYWYDIVYHWVSGEDYVCEKFGIEHGNFVRAMLKLSNILEEWVNLATIMQDVETIEKCKDFKSKLIRGFVIPDSLYLRI